MATPNYDITTPEAERFWGSRHKLNRAKAIIAFSLNESNANDNLRRKGYAYQWRQRMLRNFKQYLDDPGMKAIPFSPVDNKSWWEELTLP